MTPSTEATKPTTPTTENDTTKSENYGRLFLYWDVKVLSNVFFQSKLPHPWMEYLISAPGNWFGLPIICLYWIPICLATLPSALGGVLNENYGEKFNHHFIGSVLLLVISTLLVGWIWFVGILGINSALEQRNQFSSKWAIQVMYGPAVGVVIPWITCGLLSLLSTLENKNDGVVIAHAFMTAWSCAILPIAVLKPLVRRTRPAAFLPSSLAEQKHLVILPKLFRHDLSASFPSGDAAGAMAFCYCLWNYAVPSQVVWKCFLIFCLLASGLGRLYWLAHHMSDVLAGMLFAWLSCRFVLMDPVLKWMYRIRVDRAMTESDDYIINDNDCLYLQSTETIMKGAKASKHIALVEWWHPLLALHVLFLAVIVTRTIAKIKVFAAGTITTQSTTEEEETTAVKKKD